MRCLALTFGLIGFLFCRPGHAATFTWTKLAGGNASGSWTNQANWNGGALPTTNTDAVDFSTVDPTVDSTVTLDGNKSVSALTFGDTATATAAGWTITAGTPSGSTLTLAGASPIITVNALGTGKAALISAVIAGTNGLTKSGTTFLRLTGANTFSGGTILSGSDCRISVGNDRAFGTGLVTVGAAVGAGQLWFQSEGNRTLTNAFEIRAVRWIIDNSTAGGAVAGDLTVNGNVLLNTGPSNARDLFCHKNCTINGNVTVTPASNPMNKGGGSTLTLNGTNTVGGASAVNGGTLIVNGPMNGGATFTVNSGGTLGGTGVFSGAIVVANGGALRAGASGSGTLTCGGLTGNATAQFNLALGATNNPSNGTFRVNGNLTLAGMLNLSDLGGFGPGIYTNFYYSGTLVNSGLTVAAAPAGKTVYLDTSTTNCVLLRVLAGKLAPAAGEAVPMCSASPLALSWVAMAGATAYDIFLGTVSNAIAGATTNTAGIYLGRTNTFPFTVATLLPNTTYFWRVDGVASNGAITKGAVYSFTTGAAMVELQQDAWAVTDALGRTLPTYAEAGSKRTNRTVGVFYYVWHGAHGTDQRDITKILANYPSDPLSTNNTAWGAENAFHLWGEPEEGYFRAEDPWYIRRQLQMLSNAKVDFIYFDASNAVTYDSTVLKVCEISLQMRNEGIPTPQIAFLTYSSSGTVMNRLYDQFYARNFYPGLWFYWNGKPLILGNFNDAALRTDVRGFFTIKYSWAWTDKTKSNYWQWLDDYPQDYGWSVNSSTPEQIVVGVASHPTRSQGKSYNNGAQPAVNSNYLTDYTDHGLCFGEQWSRALQVDPPVVMVTQWNEWMAQRFIATGNGTFAGRPTKPGDSSFVDVFNQEFNRDIAPMRGGYTDNYYYQLIANIRKYKGMDAPAPPAISTPATMDLGGGFSAWTNITPVFKDPVGDTLHRNFAGYDTAVTYTNNSGRNDFIESRTTYDNDNVYFHIKTAQAITAYTDANWMVLFVDADRNHGTGWEGYDYAVNLGARTATTTTLSRTTTTNWNWTAVRGDLAYQVAGNELMLAIPRGALGLTNSPVTFDFHWADNFRTNDISGFFVNGDSAPDRRFNYRYDVPAPIIANSSFEAPPLANAGYQYGPLEAAWTFGGASGIARNGSPWYVPNAPDGAQGGFIQSSGSSISQPVYFPAGSYTIRFAVAGRGGFGSLPLNVRVDGADVLSLATTQISTNSWSNFTSSVFTVSVGVHTVAFVNGTLAGDHANVIDKVQFERLSAPALAAISDHTITAGQTLTVTNTATDANSPPQPLTFELLASPSGMSLDANSGVLTWRPTVAQSPTTNCVSVRAAVTAAPSLAATQSFSVFVLRPAQPAISAPSLSNGVFSLTVSGDAGPDYGLFASTNLTDWLLLQQTNPPVLPFRFVDPAATNFDRRFYRVILGP